MEERILDSQHRSDLSSLELRRRRLPRQRLRSCPDVFIDPQLCFRVVPGSRANRQLSLSKMELRSGGPRTGPRTAPEKNAVPRQDGLAAATCTLPYPHTYGGCIPDLTQLYSCEDPEITP